MEESPPAPARPQAAATEVTAAQEQTTVRQPRRRPHVPTSVLVTVLVAALSVWVAPALTRQWDDRQKARELRVAIAEDVIAMGTRLIYATTKPPLPGYKPAADYDAMLVRWNEDSAVLRARLYAYFPQDVLDQWDKFNNDHARPLLEFAKELPRAQKRHAAKTEAQVTAYFKRGIADQSDISFRTSFIQLSSGRAAFEQAVGLQPRTGSVEGELPKSWISDLATVVGGDYPGFVEHAISEFEEAAVIRLGHVTEEVFSAHLTGFSTTRRDFFRDLLP